MILDLNTNFGLIKNKRESFCPQVPKPGDFLFINSRS
jgi:hypothetical protein